VDATQKREGFENIIEKLIHEEYQLFNIIFTFSQEIIRFFQETTEENFKKF
jgi:hypothetical protein